MHKVARSMHQALQEDTNVCNQHNFWGWIAALLSMAPIASCRLKGGHLFDTLRVA